MFIFHQSQAANDGDDRLVRAEERLANGRLVTVQQYGFDGASRITNKFTAPKMHPASFTTFSGTYDADNRLNGFAADTDGNLLAMPGVPEGNAASAPGALGATWDARNRLTTLTGAAGWRPAFSASYAYDSEGNRISKTVGVGGVNSTTAWTVNPHGPGGLSQVLVETVNGGAKKFFVYGPTGLLYDVDSAATPNVRHFHTDQVGSTVALTNASGAVIGRAEYSAYGMVSYREGDTATPFLYNGAYGVMTDAESGLLNMRARYYHPWIGRFASPDPIGFSGGMNWFAYCDGNPIVGFDPSGLLTAVIIGHYYDGSVNLGGHSAIAMSKQGVWSFGTNGPDGKPMQFGGSLRDHLQAQAAYRDSTIYIFNTTQKQEEQMRAYLDSRTGTPLSACPTDDNCAFRTYSALAAGGIKLPIVTMPPKVGSIIGNILSAPFSSVNFPAFQPEAIRKWGIQHDEPMPAIDWKKGSSFPDEHWMTGFQQPSAAQQPVKPRK